MPNQSRQDGFKPWVCTFGTHALVSCMKLAIVKGRVSTIPDVETATVDPCYIELLNTFQVQANLVVPILQGEKLWGLLIAHHCCAPRQWKPESTQLLQQVATQMGIALRQAEMYQQIRQQAALINIASDAIFVRNLSDSRIVFWSKGAEKLYGWKADEAIGETASQLFQQDFAEIADPLEITLKQGVWQGELKQTTKSGRPNFGF